MLGFYTNLIQDSHSMTDFIFKKLFLFLLQEPNEMWRFRDHIFQPEPYILIINCCYFLSRKKEGKNKIIKLLKIICKEKISGKNSAENIFGIFFGPL